MKTYTLCVKCWTKLEPLVHAGIEKAQARVKEAGASMTVRVDVIDGRDYSEELA